MLVVSMLWWPSQRAMMLLSIIALWLGSQNTASTDVYLHADMTIKQTAIDRTRPPEITPGTYTPGPDILTWLDSL